MSEEIKDVTPSFDEQFDSENDDKFAEEIPLENLQGLDSSIDGGDSKPVFNENTLATVVEIRIKKSKQTATTKNGDDTYHPLIVNIVTQTDDGLTSYDNYGGLRLTSQNTLWCGDKSQFGKLIQLIKEEKSDIETFDDVFAFLKAGLRVKIKTQTSTYQGNEYKKNLITQII